MRICAPRDVRVGPDHLRARAFSVSRSRVAEGLPPERRRRSAAGRNGATGSARCSPADSLARACAVSATRPRRWPRFATRRVRADAGPAAALASPIAPAGSPAAVSTGGAVGIDIEPLGDLQGDDFALYLNAAERAWAGRSARRFYSVWTRKEAVAKAAGTTGLPALPAIDTTPGECRATFAGRLWRTAPIALGADQVGHVALAEMRTADRGRASARRSAPRTPDSFSH